MIIRVHYHIPVGMYNLMSLFPEEFNCPNHTYQYSYLRGSQLCCFIIVFILSNILAILSIITSFRRERFLVVNMVATLLWGDLYYFGKWFGFCVFPTCDVLPVGMIYMNFSLCMLIYFILLIILQRGTDHSLISLVEPYVYGRSLLCMYDTCIWSYYVTPTDMMLFYVLCVMSIYFFIQ